MRARHSAAGLAAAMRAFSLARMPNYWPDLRGLELLSPSSSASGREVRGHRRHDARGGSGGAPVTVPGVGHNVVLEAPEAIARELGPGRD